MGISVIIPTYNEANNLASLLPYLLHRLTPEDEIIVSDGGSSDATVAVASQHKVRVVQGCMGRSLQLNLGARNARTRILYFLHADTTPPDRFRHLLQKARSEGNDLGRFTTRFDSDSLLLKFNAFLTRFDWFICQGGDQSLFITREAFDSVGGYREELILMEDFDIVTRARRRYKYKIVNTPVLISSRKYESNGWLKVQLAHYKVIKMYQAGVCQKEIFRRYCQLLDYRY